MKMMKYLRCKPINTMISETEGQGHLVRSLGAFQLVMLGIGAIIGAGIFVLAGEAASDYAGPAVTLSFAISSFACVCAALCYAELASAIPASGSAYAYVYATLGELAAFILSGFMILGTFLTCALVAVGWSRYLQSLLADFGMMISPVLSFTTGEMVTLCDGSQSQAIANLPALGIVLAMTFVLYRGIKASAVINTIVVVMKMFVLIGFVIVGAMYIDTANWVPFIPENTGELGKFGISGVFAGAGAVFLAYQGFDAVATAAQEAKNPQRDIPIGIIGSLLVSSLAYILVAGVLTGVVHYSELGVAEPIAVAVDRMRLPWFALLIKIGALAGLTSVVLVMLYSSIRVMFAVASDGLLPQFLAKTHSRFRTPHVVTVVAGIIVSLVSATVSLENLAPLANFCIIATFAIACLAALFLRYAQPELKRRFRCPFMPWTPIVGMLVLLSIMASLPRIAFICALGLVFTMSLVYLLYSRSRSKLQN